MNETAPIPVRLELTGEYPLSDSQIQSYRENGHLCLRGVLSPEEIENWREIIREATYQHNQQTQKLEDRTEYGKAFLQVVNLYQKDERVRGITLSRRLGKIAADLMGVKSLRLYHDQALYKEPGGTPTAWHQDQTYMPFETPHLIGMWIALVPVSLEVGSMSFVSGSHRLGWLGKLPFSVEAQEPVQKIVRKYGLQYTSYGAMEPGDVTLHSAWTLHSAKGNPTQQVREIMNIFYLDGEAKITPPMSSDHKIGFYNLGEGKVDELPSDDSNPIIYRRA